MYRLIAPSCLADFHGNQVAQGMVGYTGIKFAMHSIENQPVLQNIQHKILPQTINCTSLQFLCIKNIKPDKIYPSSNLNLIVLDFKFG